MGRQTTGLGNHHCCGTGQREKIAIYLVWFLLACTVQLKHGAGPLSRCSGLCGTAMFTAKAFTLPWAWAQPRVASLALPRGNSSIAQLGAEVTAFQAR